jgi:MYXO-CTERM domain-containing protein
MMTGWVALAFVAGGCSDDGLDMDEEVEAAPSWIINGTPDTTHQAVVAVLGNNSACTGTIIHTDPNNGIGHVLTAAHCTNPQQVVIGNDYTNPQAVFPVIASQAHPNYGGNTGDPFDFRMVRISGVSASTPVIPAATPAQDNLSSGTQVRHVGYGKAGPAPGSNNTVRRQILGNLAGVSTLTIQYNQPSGGPCSGDSGGPQLTTSGTERVVGVTSYGDPSCAMQGVSGRVSAVYDSFIIPYINNAPIGPLTCDGCLEAATTGQGACIGAVNACFNDSNCNGLLQCLNGCSNQSCINQCAQQWQAGISTYNAIFTCVCDTACTMECMDEAVCQGGGSSSAVATSAAASNASSAAATTGAGGADAVSSGAGADASVGGAGTTPPGDGWNAGNATEKDYDGTVLSSGCSAGGDGSGGWWWAALALTGFGLTRRRRRTA